LGSWPSPILLVRSSNKGVYMKRVPLGFLFVATVFVGTTALVAGDGRGNPFVDHSENGETIRVLPPHAALHNPNEDHPTDAAPHAGYAVYAASYGSGPLRHHGGPTMSNASFQAIYWNSNLAAGIQGGIDAFVSSFSDNLAYTNTDPSADYTIVQQYIGAYLLTPRSSFVDTSHDRKKVPGSMSDSSVRSYLASLFANGQVVPTEDTVFGLYFPSGMKITSQGGSSCSSFCGYHGHFAYGGLDIKYAVFPYTDCRACSMAGKQVIDILTIVTSHEIREAVTDPDLNAWYDDAGYEADDKCAWHNLYQTSNGRFWVQPEYSNGNASPYPGPGCVGPNQ
jgi:hypothetical protein